MLRKALLLVAVAAIACQAAPIEDEELGEKLYINVVLGEYDTAVADTLKLVSMGKGNIFSTVVRRLIDSNQRNLMSYVYSVYQESPDVVNELLPLQFRMLFNGNSVKLIYKRDNLAMKLSYAVDSDGDRTAYGDRDDKSSERVAWKFLPFMEDNKTYFKIMSVERGEFLKAGVAVDSDGDHSVYSSHGSDTDWHEWFLNPVYYEDELLFYIINGKYDQALKLGRYVDSDGDRQVYTNRGDVVGRPELYGWSIKPF